MPAMWLVTKINTGTNGIEGVSKRCARSEVSACMMLFHNGPGNPSISKEPKTYGSCPRWTRQSS